MTRLLFLFFLLCCVVLGCGDNLDDHQDETTLAMTKSIRNGQPSTHPAAVILIDPESGWGGSGTAIHQGWAIITAQHADIDLETIFSNAVDPAADIESFNFGNIRGVLHHPELDISIAVLKEPVDDFVELIARQPVRSDGPFTLIGYGGPNMGIKYEGEVSRLEKIDETELLTRGEVNADGGDSGGTLLFEDKLAGVITNANNKVGSWTSYVNVFAIRDWIEQSIDDCLQKGGEFCESEKHEIPRNKLICAVAPPLPTFTILVFILITVLLLVGLRTFR